ncbi:hypothetical protein [Globicatella sanguinis]
MQEKIIRAITKKRASIILVVSSFLYGFQLMMHPEILDQYALYTMIRELFHGRHIGAVFVVLSLIKLFGLVKDNQIAKTISRTGLMFVWCLFLGAFLITPPPNTVWILALTMVLLISMTTLSNRG